MTRFTPVPVVIVAVLVGFAGGCSAQQRHDHEHDQYGVTYYLDGAGGGSILTNWGRGVQAGLQEAGVRGEFQCVSWQTGLGVAADQSASVSYKREQAGAVAAQIRDYIDGHPHAAVNVVGLSAGTAVAAFALEALPPQYAVDEVILLGSSLSAHYDLTDALRHVRGRVHVFTSEKDVVLGALVPIAGTADRQFCGACAAGLHGFHLPPGAGPETRRLYGKIENVIWKPEFAATGNFGGHTDAVNAAFVRTYLAPLLASTEPRFVVAGPAPMRAPDAAPQAE